MNYGVVGNQIYDALVMNRERARIANLYGGEVLRVIDHLRENIEQGAVWTEIARTFRAPLISARGDTPFHREGFETKVGLALKVPDFEFLCEWIEDGCVLVIRHSVLLDHMIEGNKQDSKEYQTD